MLDPRRPELLVRRATTALLSLSALALTGCGPTATDIQAVVNGPAKTYDDAVALREDVVDTGVECPGTDQLSAPADPETTFLDCTNGLMGMAVAGSEESMEGFLNTLGSRGRIPFLHAQNWVIISPDEASLQQLQNELGGTIVSNP
ncbi:hypothetical protein [Kocuria rosea]|jgi:hypothetical protein|uniref:hypothetical protein n=1 Tax=Kocuria rosea TaxID=1275 RepID=UPI00203D0338|nr:hypothetical protein [Kocuria rosea]MCM3689425.1 hypothetical protein [Kocuria rosea]